MGYAIAFIVIVIIFSLLNDRRSAGQAKFNKSRSAAADGSVHSYGDYDDKDSEQSSDDSSYDGGGDGGFDGGGGGGGD